MSLIELANIPISEKKYLLSWRIDSKLSWKNYFPQLMISIRNNNGNLLIM